MRYGLAAASAARVGDEAAGFAWGGAQGWGPLTLFVLSTGGGLFAICPFVASGALAEVSRRPTGWAVQLFGGGLVFGGDVPNGMLAGAVCARAGLRYSGAGLARAVQASLAQAEQEAQQQQELLGAGAGAVGALAAGARHAMLAWLSATFGAEDVDALAATPSATGACLRTCSLSLPLLRRLPQRVAALRVWAVLAPALRLCPVCRAPLLSSRTS